MSEKSVWVMASTAALARRSMSSTAHIWPTRSKGFELDVVRLGQPGNVHLTEHVCLLIEGDELVGEAAVLQTIVQVDTFERQL